MTRLAYKCESGSNAPDLISTPSIKHCLSTMTGIKPHLLTACLVSGILIMPPSIKGCSSFFANSRTLESEDSKNAQITLQLPLKKKRNRPQIYQKSHLVFCSFNEIDLKDLCSLTCDLGPTTHSSPSELSSIRYEQMWGSPR